MTYPMSPVRGAMAAMIARAGQNAFKLRCGLLAWLAFALAMQTAHAGRPMIVDDASIVGVDRCQLESWTQVARGSTEYWAVPACNFSGNLEVAFGAARITGEQGTHTAAVLQGKTLFKAPGSNGWGAGLVFGNQFNPGNGVIGDLYASVPVSIAIQDDRFTVHTNVGWMREKIEARNVMTWGLGAETTLSERTILTSETFGQRHGKPFFQLGFKHWLVVDRLQLDATYGDRFGRGNAERFVSVGLVLFTGTQP